MGVMKRLYEQRIFGKSESSNHKTPPWLKQKPKPKAAKPKPAPKPSPKP